MGRTVAIRSRHNRKALNMSDSTEELPKITAPFTEDEVDALKAFQAGPVHPYTCREDHEVGGEIRLVPTVDGLVCPENNNHVQSWAHAPEVTNGMLDAMKDYIDRGPLRLMFAF